MVLKVKQVFLVLFFLNDEGLLLYVSCRDYKVVDDNAGNRKYLIERALLWVQLNILKEDY